MPENASRDEVQMLIRNGARVLEVLGPKEYEEAHLPQAINIPLSKLNRETTVSLSDQRPIVVYCHDYQ
jgi:rhodanese-related sulfurtransferase